MLSNFSTWINSVFITSSGAKPKLTGFGGQYENRELEGTTHNTVIGNVSIGNATGDEINRDETKVQETTKNTDTGAIDAYVEGGVLDLLTESGRTEFAGNIGLAAKEMHDIVATLENTFNNKGDDSRGLLQVNGEIKTNQEKSDEIKEKLVAAKMPDEVNKAIADQLMSDNPNIKDVKFIYTTPDQAEALMKDGKAQGAGVTVDDNGVATVYVNSNLELPKNQYIGMIMEEFSHIRNYASGNDKGSGTETLGRETNDWYSNEYSDETDLFAFTSDGQYHPLGEGEIIIGNDTFSLDLGFTDKNGKRIIEKPQCQDEACKKKMMEKLNVAVAITGGMAGASGAVLKAAGSVKSSEITGNVAIGIEKLTEISTATSQFLKENSGKKSSTKTKVCVTSYEGCY